MNEEFLGELGVGLDGADLEMVGLSAGHIGPQVPQAHATGRFGQNVLLSIWSTSPGGFHQVVLRDQDDNSSQTDEHIKKNTGLWR